MACCGGGGCATRRGGEDAEQATDPPTFPAHPTVDEAKAAIHTHPHPSTPTRRCTVPSHTFRPVLLCLCCLRLLSLSAAAAAVVIVVVVACPLSVSPSVFPVVACPSHTQETETHPLTEPCALPVTHPSAHSPSLVKWIDGWDKCSEDDIVTPRSSLSLVCFVVCRVRSML